ncbi:hypothetical protein LCGC14_2635870 [marine sediment metagenome]|uniref:Uncharacterized protein n=1 Tax=marine sediment metagenome TaxID=412755 RepID=A0A0F9CRA0_9ZZZZ
MKIPIVTEAVVVAVSDEVVRNDTKYLVTSLEDYAKEQPVLIAAMNIYVSRSIELHGELAGETLLRVLVMQYKMLKVQFEVNDLEGQP